MAPFGMSDEEYDRLASAHSRAAIVWWCIGGIAYTLFRGRVFSLPTLLLFMPGIFVASFLSIPTFFIDTRTKLMVAGVGRASLGGFLSLAVATIVLVGTFLFQLLVPVAYLMACYAVLGGDKPRPASSSSTHYEARCKEPLPVFTLGEHSHPTKEQEAALCACVWQTLGGWEREVSEKIARGRESEVSWLHMQAFPSRFGSAIEKCGGMKL